MGCGEGEVLSVQGNREVLNVNYTVIGDLVAGAA